ncbi:elongation factor P 5-aminopentanone reductase [Bombilactobacillus thymidiniphilus]|uniref:SDR family oxidoreductase n=1 Tax=Bombilactobacillus thymidiniphilus TaxID=2923363 RepID=A0ABY4PC15_9LACO|nr:SDR family NAD(P)-dependent oxidoreductase [Bombilactobacillus thymidiniphilus]UQS83299.1 SDR family oxidoreductase [Bombilactobacillus thymidiniphilus]
MKWALILGATGAIGQEIVQELAQSGWSLYLQGFSQQEQLQQQVEQLNSDYPDQDFLPLIIDMTKIDELDIIVNNVFSLDALIAAQGVTDYHLFAQLPADKMTQIWLINLQFTLRLIQRLQVKLAKSPTGRIILLGSVYGKQGSAMEVMYSTTKGALSAFAKSYAKEVASLGITVNVLAPGAVDTQMNNMLSENDKNDLIAQIPLGRMAQPQDISYWVKVMLDERAQYFTGQTLYVTAGWLE